MVRGCGPSNAVPPSSAVLSTVCNNHSGLTAYRVHGAREGAIVRQLEVVAIQPAAPAAAADPAAKAAACAAHRARVVHPRSIPCTPTQHMNVTRGLP